jgi:4'-phosphopantetheinyl transferase EntD
MCPIAPNSEAARISFRVERNFFGDAMDAMLHEDSPELSTLLPRGIVTVVAERHQRAAPVLAEEADYLAAHPMRPKREAEFRAGRACAREAMSRVGIRNWPLLPAATREPRWPDGIVGSITHSGTYCAAAVARNDRCAGIGIDVEAADRVGEDLAPVVCTHSEQAALDRYESFSRAELLTLIFSAKESVFKAVFPRTRVFLEFGDVEIELEPEEGIFRAHGRTPELERLLSGIDGRFAIGQLNLATTAVLARRGDD